MGDFNGDGKVDLAVANQCWWYHYNWYPWNHIVILLGDGSGNFGEASYPAVEGLVALGDFNGDGKLDLVVSTGSILSGDGTGNFTLASSPGSGGWSPLGVGDFNQDGKLDLAIPNASDNTVSILLQEPTAEITLSPSSLDFGGQSIGITSAPKTVTLSNTGKVTTLHYEDYFGQRSIP